MRRVPVNDDDACVIPLRSIGCLVSMNDKDLLSSLVLSIGIRAMKEYVLVTFVRTFLPLVSGVHRWSYCYGINAQLALATCTRGSATSIR